MKVKCRGKAAFGAFMETNKEMYGGIKLETTLQIITFLNSILCVIDSVGTVR